MKLENRSFEVVDQSVFPRLDWKRKCLTQREKDLIQAVAGDYAAIGFLGVYGNAFRDVHPEFESFKNGESAGLQRK